MLSRVLLYGTVLHPKYYKGHSLRIKQVSRITTKKFPGVRDVGANNDIWHWNVLKKYRKVDATLRDKAPRRFGYWNVTSRQFTNGTNRFLPLLGMIVQKSNQGKKIQVKTTRCTLFAVWYQHQTNSQPMRWTSYPTSSSAQGVCCRLPTKGCRTHNVQTNIARGDWSDAPKHGGKNNGTEVAETSIND